MVTLDESIERQVMAITGNMASKYAVRKFTDMCNPESLNLMRQFRDHTQYLEEIGELCNSSRKFLINATFLDDYLIQGLDKIEQNETTPYLQSLSKILNCVPKQIGENAGLYLFMDTPNALAEKMQPEVLKAVDAYTRNPGTTTVVTTWGFLTGNYKFGDNLTELIGTNNKPGLLTQAALEKAKEIHARIK